MSGQHITLSIDDLVLEGIDPRDRTVFAAALSRELERLITAQGLPAQFVSVGGLRLPPLTAIPGETAGAMGTRAAQAIYQGFGSSGQTASVGRGGER